MIRNRKADRTEPIERGGRLSSGQKLWLQRESGFFGPGTFQLLSLTLKLGNVKDAAAETGMSYSKAWKLVAKAERQLGFKLMNRAQGGVSGGRTTLTPKCCELLDCYCGYQTEVESVTTALFTKYFGAFLK